MIIAAMLLAAAAPAPTEYTCPALLERWNSTERLAQRVDGINEKFVNMADDRVKQAKSLAELTEANTSYSASVAKQYETQERYLRRGDRILALMVAHKCTNLPTKPLDVIAPTSD